MGKFRSRSGCLTCRARRVKCMFSSVVLLLPSLTKGQVMRRIPHARRVRRKTGHASGRLPMLDSRTTSPRAPPASRRWRGREMPSRRASRGLPGAKEATAGSLHRDGSTVGPAPARKGLPTAAHRPPCQIHSCTALCFTAWARRERAQFPHMFPKACRRTSGPIRPRQSP